MARLPDFSSLPVRIDEWSSFGTHRIIDIDRRVVRFSEEPLLGKKTTWSEPVSAFKGILRRTDTVRRRHRYLYYYVSVKILVLELVHPDDQKTLRLATVDQGPSDIQIRRLWEDAARALNLPALDQVGEDVVARAARDLDQPVRDLAAAKKVSAGWSADTAPPNGIEWIQENGQQRLVLAPHFAFEPRRIRVLAIIHIVAYLFLSFIYDVIGLFMIIASFIMTLLWPALFRPVGRKEIIVTPDELIYVRRSKSGEFGRIAIPFEELESIEVQSEPTSTSSIIEVLSNFGPVEYVQIESDNNTISIHVPGRERVRWIEQFLLWATIHAPRSAD